MKRTINKSVRLSILRKLKRKGLLEGKSLRDLGKLFGVHFSQISRDMKDLPALEAEYKRVKKMLKEDA